MNDELITRKQKTEEDFKTLEERKNAINKELEEINVEQVKLQGEYRLLEELIVPEEEPEKDKKVVEGEVVDGR